MTPSYANPVGADLAGLLDSTVHIAFDRAAGELRTGRPIVIETDKGRTLVAALDGVAPHVYSTFSAFPGASLVLSAKRGQALGFNVEHPAFRSPVSTARRRNASPPPRISKRRPRGSRPTRPPPRRWMSANMPCCCRPC